MLDRISALMEELRLLTDCLAHDLRSPVSRLRAAAQAAPSRRPDESRTNSSASVVRQADSLMRILTTVLEISRSEAMTSRKQFARSTPASSPPSSPKCTSRSPRKRAARSVDAEPDLPACLGHRQLLAQAISNLLDNALHYAREGGELVLFARIEGELRPRSRRPRPGIAAADRAEANTPLRPARHLALRAAAPASASPWPKRSRISTRAGSTSRTTDPGLRASLSLPLGAT